MGNIPYILYDKFSLFATEKQAVFVLFQPVFRFFYSFFSSGLFCIGDGRGNSLLTAKYSIIEMVKHTDL